MTNKFPQLLIALAASAAALTACNKAPEQKPDSFATAAAQEIAIKEMLNIKHECFGAINSKAAWQVVQDQEIVREMIPTQKFNCKTKNITMACGINESQIIRSYDLHQNILMETDLGATYSGELANMSPQNQQEFEAVRACYAKVNPMVGKLYLAPEMQ